MSRIILITAAVVTAWGSGSGAAAGKAGVVIGWAQLRPEKDYVFMRARAAADNKKTPYGLFIYDRKTDQWTAGGVASGFSGAVDYLGEKIAADDFFYSKQGYEEIPYGNFLYRISWKDGKAVISAEGGSRTERYVSPQINSGGGVSREYQFKHIAGGRLWFDMRVMTDTSMYSEGIGYFDTAAKQFRIYDAKSMGLRTGESIITRITGMGRNTWIGVSFCGKESCLAEGALIEINDSLSKPVFYTSSNSGIPAGAVLDVMPDEDALWVAASSGVSRWTPGGSAAKVYKVGGSLTIAGNEPARLCYSCGKPDAPFLQSGDEVDISGYTGDGFFGVSKTTVSAWIRLAEDMTVSKYDGAPSRLVAPGSGDILFLSEPSDVAATLGKFSPSGKPVTFKIIEINEEWAKVDMSANVWAPVESAILTVK